jgi:hypothetical protein
MKSFKQFITEAAEQPIHKVVKHKSTGQVTHHVIEDQNASNKKYTTFHVHNEKGHHVATVVTKANRNVLAGADHHMKSLLSDHGYDMINEAAGDNQAEAEYHELMTAHHLINEYGAKDTHADQLRFIKSKADDLKTRITPERAAVLEDHTKAGAAATKAALDKQGYGEVHRINWTAKPGDIKRATGGDHDESQQDNPADVTMSFHPGHHPKEFGPHIGVSLKAGKNADNKGAKNPGGTLLDDRFGTKSVEMYKKASADLAKQTGTEGMTNDARKKHLRDNGLEGAALEHGRKTFSAIRDHVHATMDKHLKTTEGQDHMKKFLQKDIFNTATDMRYVKTSTKGNDVGNVSAKCENYSHNGHLAKLLNDQKTTLSVEKGGGTDGGSTVHFFAHHPDHGKIKIGHMQMKSASLHGCSSLRPSAFTGEDLKKRLGD